MVFQAHFIQKRCKKFSSNAVLSSVSSNTIVTLLEAHKSGLEEDIDVAGFSGRGSPWNVEIFFQGLK